MKTTLEHYLQEYHTKESIKSYLYLIEHFIRTNPRAKYYTYQDIVQYLDEISKHYKSEVTRGTRLSAIKKYYDYLLMIGEREDHPCRKLYIKRPKHQVQLQNLFTPTELELLLHRENRYKNLEARNKSILMLLIYQGLRSEELCRLTLDNIDLDNGTVHIKSTQTTSSRTLGLHGKQILLLDKYINTYRNKLYQGSSKRLFITHRGVPVSVETIGRMIRPLRGLFFDRTLNPNTIRQSVISNWLNVKKYPLGDVQIMAGHKYPSSTERYLTTDHNEQRKIINQFHPLK